MTNTRLPKLSVIIPVYNGAKTITGCLSSILEQNYPKDLYEIIVVDNKSTDETIELVRKYPVKLLSETNIQSPSAARNTGTKQATGEILIFFDADQVADKNYLHEIISGFENPEYGAFGGRCLILENPKYAYLADCQWVSEEIIQRGLYINGKNYHMLGAGISAYKKEIFDQLNGFDPTMFSSEDFDLALRLQRQLNLKIKYNFDAICYHHSRGARGLLKREYRIGLGDEYFGDKYPELKKSKLLLFFKIFKRSLLGILSLIFNLFRFTSWEKKKVKLLTIWQDLGMQWANFLGRIHYRLFFNNRRIPADW